MCILKKLFMKPLFAWDFVVLERLDFQILKHLSRTHNFDTQQKRTFPHFYTYLTKRNVLVCLKPAENLTDTKSVSE